MSEGPEDPLTPLREGAAQMHEVFASYIEAGFTEMQAMQLIIAILQAGIFGNSQ